MELHHLAWLAGHPERDEAWLCARLADGFDVHHIDGDHTNNDPANLVLIDHVDHMRLHGLVNSYRLRKLSGPKAKTLRKGRVAYEARASGASWREARERVGSVGPVTHNARLYAQTAGLPWPPRARAK